MIPIEFSEVIWFINTVGNTTIDEHSKREVSKGCHIFDATIDGSALEIKLSILYVDQNSTVDSYPTAIKSLKTGGVNQIILSDALHSRKDTFEKTFSSYIDSIHTLTSYLFSIIAVDTTRYSQELRKYHTDLYVHPQVETNSLKFKKHANPIRAWFEENQVNRHTKTTTGSIGVLLAEPGQGKTFTAQYIAAQQAKNKTILPVYIQSLQWDSLKQIDKADLSKVITHSFASHSTPLPWVEGMEEKFVSLFLRIGVLRIIFDGFDEYIYMNRERLKPADVLNSLATLANETGSKILITSRTSFWESEISAQNDTHDDCELTKFKLFSFSRDMSIEYFRRWFSTDDNKQRRANKITDELNVRYQQGRYQNLGGRGYIMYLIADLINRTSSETASDLGGMPVLDWIFKKLCERECTRQNLVFSSDQQIEILENLCEFMHSGYTDKESLEFAIEMVENNLPKAQISHNARLLGSHPLLRRVAGEYSESERWEFMHEQVHMHMLISHIMKVLLRPEQGRLCHFRIKAALHDVDYWESAVEALYGFIHQRSKQGEFNQNVKDVIARLMTLAAAYPEDSEKERYIATSLGLMATDDMCEENATKIERSNYFLSYFPSNEFSSLFFNSSIHNFDFSGRIVTNCQFQAVTFVTCDFNTETLFKKCKFKKINLYKSQSLSIVSIDKSNSVDNQTNRIITSGRIANGMESYTKDLVHDDLLSVLDLLSICYQSGHKNITARDLRNSIVAPKEIQEPFLKRLVSYTLIKRENKTWDPGRVYSLRPDVDIALRQYVESGALTGPLAECEKSLNKEFCE